MKLCNYIFLIVFSSVENLHLNIVTKIEPPFVEIAEESTNMSSFPKLKGFCIDLFELIIETHPDINYSYHFVKDNGYGNLVNGEWNGMIGELYRNETDMILAALTVTSLRQEYVIFTKPFMNADLGFLIHSATEEISWYGYLMVFDYNVWMILLASLTGFSMLLYMITESDKENTCSMFDFVINTISILTAQGPVIHPSNLAGKIMCVFFWIFSLMIITYFTAKLTANFTTQNLQSTPKSIEDLLNFPDYTFGTTTNGAVFSAFKYSQYNSFEKLYNIMINAAVSPFVASTKLGIEKARQNSKYAFISESPFLHYHVLREPCNLDLVVSYRSPTTGGGYGIALRRASTDIREAFSQRIVELHENGQLSVLRKKWWTDQNECPVRETSIDFSQSPISIYQTAGLFLILSGGATIGLIIKLIEVARKFLNKTIVHSETKAL